jgi:hypothetical protein
MARERHTIAGRQCCGSKARIQAKTPDGAPQRRWCHTKEKPRREKRGRWPQWCSRWADGVVVAGSRVDGGMAKVFSATWTFTTA